LFADTALKDPPEGLLLEELLWFYFPEFGRKPPAVNWKLFSKFFAIELWLLLNWDMSKKLLLRGFFFVRWEL